MVDLALIPEIPSLSAGDPIRKPLRRSFLAPEESRLARLSKGVSGISGFYIIKHAYFRGVYYVII